MQITIKPVIIAGGSGARLWPLSNASYPKQFIQTLSGLSAFQRTILRHRILGEPTIIINKEHVDVAAHQILEIGLKASLVIEPEQTNTAACAVLGALLAQNSGRDNVLLLPSDHNIADEDLYLRTLFRGFEHLNIMW
jgi:mannose-1-phosphate guanylyltransferase/mannose-6-phosphate isomerase